MDAEIRALIELMPRLRGKEIKARVLDGGLTNRNYHIECEGDEYVLRVMGKNSTLLGIERKFEHTCAQAAHVAGVGPEVVEFLPDPGAMLSRFVAGRALVPTDLHQPAIMQRVVKSLHQYHECASGAGNFSAFETVRRYYARALERQVSIPQNIVQAFEISARIEKEVGLPESVCPCHNDLLSGNLIDDGRSIWILDWEYARAGDAFFDLGNLAANNLFTPEHETMLLQIYFGRARPADLRRLRLMRLASDLREAMWGFLQMGISTLDFDYRSYAHHHLERFQKGADREVGEQGLS